MRIRKNASKLLGSASAYHSSPPPSQLWPPAEEKPWDCTASASGDAAAGLVCELNRSPWDVMPNLHHTLFQGGDEEEEEDGSIRGDEIKIKKEPISPLMERMAAERRNRAAVSHTMGDVHSLCSEASMKETEEEGGKKEDKKKIRRKRRKKEIDSNGVAAAHDTVVYCKKSDGKGWQCKRPAQLPHSLCNYHLTQLRSYSYNHSSSKAATGAVAGGGNGRSPKKKAGSAGAGTSFYYYYYSGFGPWRGKRRGGDRGGGDSAPGGGDSIAGAEEEVEERRNENSQNGDAADAPVAGADEAEDDEDIGGGRRDDLDSSREGSSAGETEDKKKNYRKRGRKPVKARSLKSLL